MQLQSVNIKPRTPGNKIVVRPVVHQPVHQVIRSQPAVEYVPLGFPRQIRAKYGLGPSEDGYTLQAGKIYTATEQHKQNYIVIKMGKDEVAWKYKHFEEMTR